MTFEKDSVHLAVAEVLTNKDLTSGTNTFSISLTSSVSGTLPVANGGTGGGSASAARTNLGAANVAGDTFTGLLSFSGSLHAGLKLNNLTTTERDALTPSAGMVIWNITKAIVEFYNGSAWIDLRLYFPVNATAKTGNYTLTATDGTILFDATSGALTATLPTAVGIAGRTYIIKKVDSTDNAVAIATTSSQTVDGAASSATTLINQYEKIRVQSDGTNWLVL